MTTLERPQLLRILDAALTDRHVVITAPAGYGKSTVLRHLSRSRPYTYLLALTPADADLAVLQNRLEPLLTTRATLLLDDIQHVEESPELQAWITQQLRREDLRFVLSGRTRLAWLLDTFLINGQALSSDTEERKLVQHRQNLAVAILIPLGKYAQAAEIIQQTLRYFADAPAPWITVGVNERLPDKYSAGQVAFTCTSEDSAVAQGIRVW